MPRPTNPDSLMGAMRLVMDKMIIGEEFSWDTTNRNFSSVRTTYTMLKVSNHEMLNKKFTSRFSDDHALFFVKRTA